MKEVKLGRCKLENAKIVESYGNKLLVCGGERIAKISSKNYLYINYEKLNRKNAVYLNKFWDSYKDKAYGMFIDEIFDTKLILKFPDNFKNKRLNLNGGFWERF